MTATTTTPTIPSTVPSTLQRLSRAAQIRDAGKVKARWLGRGRYIAEGSRGQRYNVRIGRVVSPSPLFGSNSMSCECGDHTYKGNLCKHLLAAVLDAGVREELDWEKLDAYLSTKLT